MRVMLINKLGMALTFDNMKKASPYIKAKWKQDYEIKEIDGKKVRVYDDREIFR
jgi:hypothetical protein